MCPQILHVVYLFKIFHFNQVTNILCVYPRYLENTWKMSMTTEASFVTQNPYELGKFTL